MSEIKDKNILESIKNYSEEITTLKDFITAVRSRPGMYLTGIGNRGYLGMFREVWQNAFDELMRGAIGKSPCNQVYVYFEEGSIVASVEDNGRGIPFDKMIDIFFTQHTSSNYTKGKGDYSAGWNGVGAKLTNALSSWFTVESYILGEARKVEFNEGYPSDKGVQVIENKGKQGTKVSFQPNFDVMGPISVTCKDIIGLIELLGPLTPIGSVFNFEGLDINNKKVTNKFINEDGILTYIIRMTVNPLIKPIIYSYDTGEMKVDIAFTYDSQDLGPESIMGFGNFCYTSKGTHMRGFLDGVSKFFRDYMNKIYLANTKSKKKITVIDSDVKTGLKAVVSAAHIAPQFIGQDKDELDNGDLYPFVRDLTLSSLEQWSKDNPSDLQKICKYLKDVAELRLKSEGDKIKLSNKYKASILDGLPAKYIKPSGKEHLELIICEGDSALGSARNSRCKIRQGLFPIRGKIANAFTMATKDFLNNEEVAGIISIVGGRYGKSFDITKVKWEKIIFMADADKDGCHINNLLLKLFLLYMRPMIEDGRVYRAVPPLYGAKKNGKYIYFTNRLDFVKYTQEIFLKNNKILSHKGKELTNLELMDLLYRNVDYTYELERIANRYAINPYLLELICLNLNDKSAMEDAIRKTFRFINIETRNNTVVINGLINDKYQTVFINEQFISDLNDVLEILNNNVYKYYYLNNELVALYKLMKTFESNSPDVVRYKGLGEMNSLQLADSTLHPDSNRTLIRYTLEDAIKEIDAIRYLESNKFDLIKDVKASRIDIIG